MNKHIENMDKKKYPVTVIRRSRLTGNIVWIYRGASKAGARQMYWLACKKELERVKELGVLAERRCSNVAKILAECTASLPLTADMSDEQKNAARQLQSVMKQGLSFHMDFFEHIMDESRARNEASLRWRNTRSKWFENIKSNNAGYDK